MNKPCDAFEMTPPLAAYKHIQENCKVIIDYGDECNGHLLHTWDDGYRRLGKCEKCGGYILIQVSEFHGMEDDALYRDYIPADSVEQADEINREYNRFNLEMKYPGKYLIADPGRKPHWSKKK